MEAWDIERARHAVEHARRPRARRDDDRGHESAPVERGSSGSPRSTRRCTFAALALVLLPPLVDGQWGTWFYRGLIFLVPRVRARSSSPLPSRRRGLTSAARRGVLFKGGGPLERVATATAPTLEARARRSKVQCRTRPPAARKRGRGADLRSRRGHCFLVGHSSARCA